MSDRGLLCPHCRALEPKVIDGRASLAASIEWYREVVLLQDSPVGRYFDGPPVDMHEEGVRVMKETTREKDIRIAAQLVQIDGLRERVERWERVVEAAGLKLVITADDWMLVSKP